VKRTPMFRAALSALWLPIACSPDVVPQDTTASSGPAPGSENTDTGPTPDPSPEPDGAGTPGAPCQVDADCSAANFCALRICILGCTREADCDGGEVCDPHGRCAAHDEDMAPAQLAGMPVLAERFTVLASGETQARTILRNDGAAPLVYRLAASSPALKVDTAIAVLGPADEVELVAEVDLTALGPADRVLPIQIITSGGAVAWSLELEALPESGRFRGAVSFDRGELWPRQQRPHHRPRLSRRRHDCRPRRQRRQPPVAAAARDRGHLGPDRRLHDRAARPLARGGLAPQPDRAGARSRAHPDRHAHRGRARGHCHRDAHRPACGPHTARGRVRAAPQGPAGGPRPGLRRQAHGRPSRRPGSPRPASTARPATALGSPTAPTKPSPNPSPPATPVRAAAVRPTT
jgi:hypothetical protein